MTEKLKSFLQNDRHFFGLLLIVTTVISFLLGRASIEPTEPDKIDDNIVISQAFITDTQARSEIVSSVSPASTGAVFVASKNGTKYHRQDCPGAAQIKPENRIEFSSATAAAAAGYTPAANCPGLE